MILYEKRMVIVLILIIAVLYVLSLLCKDYIDVFDTYKSVMPSFHLEPIISVTAMATYYIKVRAALGPLS